MVIKSSGDLENAYRYNFILHFSAFKYLPMCPFAQAMCKMQFPLSSRISFSISGPCSITKVCTSSRSPYLHASSRSSLSSSVRYTGAGIEKEVYNTNGTVP